MNKLHHPGSPQAPCGSPGISRRCGSRTPHLSSPRTAPPAPGAFTLTELLVAAAIILGLMTLVSAAAAAARTSQKANATRSLINRLDIILQSQFQRYASANVASSDLNGVMALLLSQEIVTTKSAARAWFIRRNLIAADLPDSWSDVRLLASGTCPTITGTDSAPLPVTSPQQTYRQIWNGRAANPPTNDYGDAECLFMIVMQSGIADQNDVGTLRSSDIGDKDQDGAQEFWDAWGNPIRFVLWPAGFELPPGSGLFFSMDTAFPNVTSRSPRPTLGMRPLIFSGGPDGTNSMAVNGGSHIAANLNCGNPENNDVKALGGLPAGETDRRADNITNFDAEVKQ